MISLSLVLKKQSPKMPTCGKHIVKLSSCLLLLDPVPAGTQGFGTT